MLKLQNFEKKEILIKSYLLHNNPIYKIKKYKKNSI